MKLRIPVVGGRLHLFSTSYSKYLVTHFKARFPWEKVRWTNCVFLIGTFLLSVSVMPAYFWRIGLSVFQVALFIFFFAATGLSITLGYHRLARDSLLMAWFTFGEGYHNFHHEFQHDYRNGVKPWQFDPTKW